MSGRLIAGNGLDYIDFSIVSEKNTIAVGQFLCCMFSYVIKKFVIMNIL